MSEEEWEEREEKLRREYEQDSMLVIGIILAVITICGSVMLLAGDLL